MVWDSEEISYETLVALATDTRTLTVVSGAGRVEGTVPGRPEGKGRCRIGFYAPRADGARFTGSIYSDDDGRFVLPVVPEGRIYITAGEREPVAVDVPGGGTVEVEIP